jgi:hypothetical protein
MCHCRSANFLFEIMPTKRVQCTLAHLTTQSAQPTYSMYKHCCSIHYTLYQQLPHFSISNENTVAQISMPKWTYSTLTPGGSTGAHVHEIPEKYFQHMSTGAPANCAGSEPLILHIKLSMCPYAYTLPETIYLYSTVYSKSISGTVSYIAGYTFNAAERGICLCWHISGSGAPRFSSSGCHRLCIIGLHTPRAPLAVPLHSARRLYVHPNTRPRLIHRLPLALWFLLFKSISCVSTS